MNQKRDSLAQLIKSLSKAEKRYFVDFFHGYCEGAKPPLFLKLYQDIETGKSELLKVLDSSSPQVLTTTKKRLYTNILKSLRALHEDTSIDITIQNQLSQIEILYRLGLPEQGLFQLQKTYELARTHEKFGLVLQILEWEKRLNIVTDTPSRSTHQIVAEEKAVLKMYGQVMDLENLFAKAKQFKRQYGFAKGKLKTKLEKETIKAAAMPAASGCHSQKAAYYFNFIHALYYWMTFDHLKAYAYSKELLASEVKVVLPSDYIDGIFEHITSSVCVGRFTDAIAGITLGVSYVEQQKLNQSHAFMLRMFAYQGTYQLIVYNYMGDAGKLKSAIAATEGKLKLYDSILPFETRQVIMGNLMNAYMGVGALEKADRIWDSMFNKQAKTIRRDIYADLFLFRLTRLLQSRLYVLLPSAAAAALRYFRKSEDAQNIFPVEMAVATLLTKEREYEKMEVLREILEQIKSVVQGFIASLDGALGFQEHYTRYLIWCDAILDDQPYHIAASKWYKQFTGIKPVNGG